MNNCISKPIVSQQTSISFKGVTCKQLYTKPVTKVRKFGWDPLLDYQQLKEKIVANTNIDEIKRSVFIDPKRYEPVQFEPTGVIDNNGFHEIKIIKR